MQHLRILLLIVFLGLTTSLLAEDATKMERAELSRETILKKYPTLDSPSVGKLPKGTILDLTGEEDNGFAEAEVELSNGTVANGWVEIPGIKGREGEGAPKKQKKVESQPKKKLTVPKDEGVLLRREQTFYYGLSGGFDYGMLSYVDAEETFNGTGFNGDAHLGLYFNSYSRLQLNVGYLRVDGKDSEANELGFGYLNVSLEGQLVMEERLLVFAALGYLNGIGITAAPASVAITGAGDASSLFTQVGVGYRVPLTDVTSLGFKTSYLFGFSRDPIGTQAILFNFFIDFEG